MLAPSGGCNGANAERLGAGRGASACLPRPEPAPSRSCRPSDRPPSMGSHFASKRFSFYSECPPGDKRKAFQNKVSGYRNVFKRNSPRSDSRRGAERGGRGEMLRVPGFRSQIPDSEAGTRNRCFHVVGIPFRFTTEHTENTEGRRELEKPRFSLPKSRSQKPEACSLLPPENRGRPFLRPEPVPSGRRARSPLPTRSPAFKKAASCCSWQAVKMSTVGAA